MWRVNGGNVGADDRLELIEVVYSTATRRVSKAYDRSLRQVVSVTSEPLLGRDPDALLAQLQPYMNLPAVRALAPLLDAYVEDDRVFMVSPWVEGVDLLALLQASGSPGLPVTAVLGWLDDVGEVVRHLGLHGLRHGDVRPANLILGSEQRILVIGLGTGVLDGADLASTSLDVRGVAATAAALLTGTSPTVGAITGTTQVSGAALQRALLPALDEHRQVPVTIDTLLQGLRQELSAALPTGVVTFLLTDIVGSTRQWEADEASMAAQLARHDLLMGEAVDAAGGRLLKARGEGDATFSVFTKASAAVAAALDAQERLRNETTVVVRMAIHTGEAELREADYFGRTVNRAARLRSIAPDGGIVVSSATGDLVVDTLPAGTTLLDRGQMALKDLDRAERVYQIVGPGLPAPTDEAPAPAPIAPGVAAPVVPAPVLHPGAVAPAAPAASPAPVAHAPAAPPHAPTSSGGGSKGGSSKVLLVAAVVVLVALIGAAVALLGGGGDDGDTASITTTTSSDPAEPDTQGDTRRISDLLLTAADLPAEASERNVLQLQDDDEPCGQRSVDLRVPPSDRAGLLADDSEGGLRIIEVVRRYSDDATARRGHDLVLESFSCPTVTIANTEGESSEGAVSAPTPLTGTTADDAQYVTLSFPGATVGIAIVLVDEYQVVLQYASFQLTGSALVDEVRTLAVAALRQLEPSQA